MEDLFSLFISPLGLVVLFFIIGLGIIFILKPLNDKKKYSNLLSYFNAQFLFPFSTIKFLFKGHTFYIDRISRGGGAYGGGGSYPVLRAYIEKSPKFIIGNAQSKNYTRGNFLRLPPYEIFKSFDNELLIGSSDHVFMDELKTKIFNDHNLAQDLSLLMKEKFAHLTVAGEFHITGKFIERKNVFRFTCLSEEIYQNPMLLKTQLEVILDVFGKAGVKIF